MAFEQGEALALVEALRYFARIPAPGQAPISRGRAAETAEWLRQRAARTLGSVGVGLGANELSAAMDTLPPTDEEIACRVCGCTEDRPCEGGCCWVPDPLMLGDVCSACPPHLIYAAGLSDSLLDVLLEVGRQIADHLPDPTSRPGVERELTVQMIQSLSTVLIEPDAARRRAALIGVAALASHLAHSLPAPVPDPEPDQVPA